MTFLKIKFSVASPNTSTTTSNSVPRFTLLAFLSRDALARSQVRKLMVLHSQIQEARWNKRISQAIVASEALSLGPKETKN
jgi:hypothetical protein